jgi:hypothetical protein
MLPAHLSCLLTALGGGTTRLLAFAPTRQVEKTALIETAPEKTWERAGPRGLACFGWAAVAAALGWIGEGWRRGVGCEARCNRVAPPVFLIPAGRIVYRLRARTGAWKPWKIANSLAVGVACRKGGNFCLASLPLDDRRFSCRASSRGKPFARRRFAPLVRPTPGARNETLGSPAGDVQRAAKREDA